MSLLRRDGTPRSGSARRAGVALEEARHKKETTYPELVEEGGRARLVVLAAEIGSRWSDDGSFPPKSCEGEGRVCATSRVVEEVELHPGVQRREGFRFVSIPSGHEVVRDDRFA